MPDPDNFDADSPAVQTHLTMIQGVINRMASNSAGCKTWSATLSAAIFVLAFAQGVDLSPLVALVPIVLLAYQDIAYLTLERDLRRSYNGFVSKLHDGSIGPRDLFVIQPLATVRERIRAASSWSVILFYPPLVAASIGLHFA